jgi:hypothetical protein
VGVGARMVAVGELCTAKYGDLENGKSCSRETDIQEGVADNEPGESFKGDAA